jgi:hypothetical protein
MGFTKLDEGILQSSIMAEKSDVFKVWIALLASCGSDGVSKVSSIFLSSACHLSLRIVDHAIEILSMPDPRSRSLSDEGRRIRRVDGGYFLVNYDKYRAFSYSDNPEAIRKREYRHRIKDDSDSGHSGTCPGHSASASASSFINKNLKEDDLDHLFEELWKSWPAEGRAKKHWCKIKFRAIRSAGKLQEFIKVQKGYIKYLEHQEKNKGFKQNCMHLGTFLDNWEGDRERYLNFKYEPRL